MSQTKKAAIAIDKWKREIFERHLKQSGYQFSCVSGLTEGTWLISVHTTNLEALHKVVKEANTEAAMTGAPK